MARRSKLAVTTYALILLQVFAFNLAHLRYTLEANNIFL